MAGSAESMLARPSAAQLTLGRRGSARSDGTKRRRDVTYIPRRLG